MWSILILIAIVLLVVTIRDEVAQSTTYSDNPSGFEIRVREATEQFQGVTLKVFIVEMRGTIVASCKNFDATTRLIAWDVTEGENRKKPIISAIEQLQLDDSVALGFTTSQRIPYQMSKIASWVTLVKIPLDALTFPRKGKRKILFGVDIARTLASAKTTITHACNDSGYLDQRENRQKFDALAAELAFAVSSSDNQIDHSEAGVIKKWIKQRIGIMPPKEQEGHKNRLNNIMRKAMESFNKGESQDVAELCRQIKAVSSVAERYESLELCLQVAEADGVAEQDELNLLETLATQLEIDKDKFRTMKDKHLSVSMMNSKDIMDIDKLLGIEPKMTVAEQKKHLRNEFKKWNQLVEHKDAKKREQAKEMLDLIGKKRAELKRD